MSLYVILIIQRNSSKCLSPQHWSSKGFDQSLPSILKNSGFGPNPCLDTQFNTHNLTLEDDKMTILGTQKSWLHFSH